MATRRRYSQWSQRVARNIRAAWHAASDTERIEGLSWYETANRHAQAIANRHGVTLAQAVGVIAAISPGHQWERNLVDAELFVSAYTAGARGNDLPVVGAYGRANRGKAERILAGAEPLGQFSAVTSPKVRAFYLSILSPDESDAVCVDRHSKCLAFAIHSDRNAQGAVRPAEYRFLTWHYTVIAEHMGVRPHQLQAVTWLCWRRQHATTVTVPF